MIVFRNFWEEKINLKSNLLRDHQSRSAQYERTCYPSGNGEAHDSTRDDATGVSRCAAPQRWRCPNQLFLGANRGTSCPVNTCHHWCFSVGEHAEGERNTCSSTGSELTGHATRMHFVRRLHIFGYAARWREIGLSPIFSGCIDLSAMKLGDSKLIENFGVFSSLAASAQRHVLTFIHRYLWMGVRSK